MEPVNRLAKTLIRAEGRRHTNLGLLVGAALLALAPCMAEDLEAQVVSVRSVYFPKAPDDFGAHVEALLESYSNQLFGIEQPLAKPATSADTVPREHATADQRVLLAEGLHAEFVTRRLARMADQMVLWPSPESPTHILFCIEQSRSGRTPGGGSGANPSVQRVDLSQGTVSTMLYGMNRCDGIRATNWGTVLVAEETIGGRTYEILDPLHTTGHWVADPTLGDIREAVDGFSQSHRIAQRSALPRIAWEGLTVLPGGGVVGGDEKRPGDGGLDTDGGAIFKFVPFARANGVINDLSRSPLTRGRTYALTVSCVQSTSSSFPQYGQGCEIGDAAWVEVSPDQARAQASTRGATGYFRPEDMHTDPLYPGPGVRFCWTNTGSEAAAHFAEVLCVVDPNPLPAQFDNWIDSRTGRSYLADAAGPAPLRPTTAVVSRFLAGSPRFNSFDNLAFQPKTGVLYLTEDHQFGEIIACLRDGADLDELTDGCIAVASVRDPQAEPTGLEFEASGLVAYLVIQHGQAPPELQDFSSNPIDGRTDDLIRIRGFRLP